MAGSATARLRRLLEAIPSGAGWILALSLILTALAVGTLVDLRSGKVRLEIDPSADRLLPEDDAERRFYDRTRRLFGSDDTLLVAVAADDVFESDVLRRIERMTERIEALDGVHHVLSLSNALDVRLVNDDLEIAPFVRDVPEDASARDTVRRRVQGNPVYAGSLVSKDSRATALLVYLLDMSNREYLALGLGRQIEQIAQEERGDTEVWLTGAPRLREETARVLLGETWRLSLSILVVLGGVLMFSFRTVRGVVLPLLTIVLSVVWTCAVVVLTGQSLNAVTALVPPLLTALGLSYSVHVVSEYYEMALDEPGLGRRELVGAAMQRVALPVILTGLTTAAGFASLMLSPLGAVHDFGVLAMLGVLFTVLASLSFTPAVLAFLPTPRPGGRGPVGSVSGPFHRSIERIARFDFRQRRLIFAVAFAVFVLAIFGTTRVRLGTQQISKFQEDAPVRVHFEAVNEKLQGANPFSVVVESSAPAAFKEPFNLKQLEALQGWLEAQPEVGGTTSMVNYLALLNRGFGASDEATATIPDSRRVISQLFLFGASKDLDRFVDSRFQSTKIQVRARVIDSDEIAALTSRIEARLAELPAHLEGKVTGTVVVLNRALDDIIRGQAVSIVAALVMIYGILAAMFVSLRVGAIALIPNVLPVVFYFGALGLTGIRLDTATSLIAPMVLGIAVDDTIHYFARFINEAKRLGNEERATVSALQTVGRPVTFTSLALCLGFLTLNSSELRTQGELGSMAALTLAFAWTTDFFLTPALCARLRIATLWDLLAVDLGSEPHRAIPLFKGLRSAQARIVGLMGSVLELRAGERLFNVGEPGEALYVVIDGSLRASVGDPDGNHDIALHRRGDVLGEVGLFHGRRTADVDAEENARLLRFTADNLDHLGRRYPRIAALVHRNLNEVQANHLARNTRLLTGQGPAPAVPADLREKGRALEDAFFRGAADRYRDQLSDSVVSGVTGGDPAVIERLTRLGIGADTLAALTLIPLVEVAWADGHMDPGEREAVLTAARSNGLSSESASFALLSLWIDERPEPALLEAWRDYMAAVARELSVETRFRLRDGILGRARAVAESAGGFVGLGTVSREEEALLEDLESAFNG